MAGVPAGRDPLAKPRNHGKPLISQSTLLGLPCSWCGEQDRPNKERFRSLVFPGRRCHFNLDNFKSGRAQYASDL